MTLQNWQRLNEPRIIRLDQAIDCYLKRQARQINPDGYFDNAGRWYPSTHERQPSCDSIRESSRSYPFSLNKHCRSMNYIAHDSFQFSIETVLFDVDLRFLRRRVREMRNEFFSALRDQCIAEARARPPRQNATSPPPAITDRPGGKALKLPARLPFANELTPDEADDLDALLKEIEGLIDSNKSADGVRTAC